MAESESWERQTLEKVALAAVTEQRRARKWGIFFKIIGFLYLTFILIMALGLMNGADLPSTKSHTALVDLDGVIAPGSQASAERIIEGLQAAFKNKHAKGVILRINSPGGSPVQAGQINDEIKRLRTKHPAIPLYAVVEDICASGGYYVAVAADKIYVDKASLVGSIGVLMDGFGFTGTMDKLGVERRLMTAGENKGFLDPFSPVDPQQKAHAQTMLSEIHEQFIQTVKKGRGARLKETEGMFSGLIWTGERSIALGMADAIGSMDFVAREVIKAEDIVDYTPRQSLADRFAKRFGSAAAQAILPGINTQLR
ncbi:MAG: S49 family peptidase [Burkholderiales bacterium]|nr:S49 family peptidase [Burkholderiales bacterium]